MKRMNRMKMMNPGARRICAFEKSFISHFMLCFFLYFLIEKTGPVLSLGHKINRPIPEAGSALHGTTWALPCLGHESRDWMDQTVDSSKSFLTCYEGSLFRSKVFLIRFPFHNETQRCEIWFEKCLQVLSIKDPFWNLSKRNWTNRNFLGQSLWDQPEDQPCFLLSKMHIITTQLMESHLLTWWPSSLLFVCHTDASFHLSQWPLVVIGILF